MPKSVNAVRVNCSTTGAGTTLTLGTAPTGFRTLAAALSASEVAVGDTLSITIDDGTAREITTATVGAGGTTITRAATPRFSTTGATLNLSGSAVISFGPAAEDLNTPDLFGTPGAPQSGLVRLGESPLAGYDWPSWRTAQALERFSNPLLGKTKLIGLVGMWNSGLAGYNINPPTVITTLNGTGTGPANQNTYAARQHAVQYFTTATAGGIGGFYGGSGNASICAMPNGSGAGGFAGLIRFCTGSSFGESGLTAASRGFFGITTSGAAPTNVNPSTLTNVIGLAKIDGSNNLNLVFGGSTPQTPVDLGVNFPATASFGNFYELLLSADPNSQNIAWQVNRWSGASAVISNTTSGVITNTTPGTTLPAALSALIPSLWITNNTEAVARNFCFNSLFFWSD